MGRTPISVSISSTPGKIAYLCRLQWAEKAWMCVRLTGRGDPSGKCLKKERRQKCGNSQWSIPSYAQLFQLCRFFLKIWKWLFAQKYLSLSAMHGWVREKFSRMDWFYVKPSQINWQWVWEKIFFAAEFQKACRFIPGSVYGDSRVEGGIRDKIIFSVKNHNTVWIEGSVLRVLPYLYR